NRATLAEKVRKEGAVAAADAFLPRLLGTTTHTERPELVTRLRERILATSPAGVADALHGLPPRADSAGAPREIPVPPLVLCGVADTITPLPESEAMHAAIAGSRLEVVPRAGHLANLESPADVNRPLQDFLGGIR